MHRRLLISGKADNGAAHTGPRDEAVRRHIRHDLRLRIILHGEGKRPVVLRSGSDLHTVGNLLLHHDRDTFQRNMILKESHDDRRRYVIGKVRHDLDRSAAVLLLNNPIHINLEDVVIDNRNVVIFRERVLKNRNQVFINLYRDHLAGVLRQILCHRADSRPHLKDAVLLRDSCRRNNPVQHRGVDEKVLPKLLLEIKIVFLQYLYGIAGDAQGCHLPPLLSIL